MCVGIVPHLLRTHILTGYLCKYSTITSSRVRVGLAGDPAHLRPFLTRRAEIITRLAAVRNVPPNSASRRVRSSFHVCCLCKPAGSTGFPARTFSSPRRRRIYLMLLPGGSYNLKYPRRPNFTRAHAYDSRPHGIRDRRSSILCLDVFLVF